MLAAPADGLLTPAGSCCPDGLRVVLGDTFPAACCPEGFRAAPGDTRPICGADGLRRLPGDPVPGTFFDVSPICFVAPEGLRDPTAWGAEGFRVPKAGGAEGLREPVAAILGEVACLPPCFNGTGLIKVPGGRAPVGRRSLVTNLPADWLLGSTWNHLG